MDALYAYRGILWEGTVMTVALSLTSLSIAVALGIVGAAAKLSTVRWAKRLAGLYTTLVRSIPDLCLLLLLYFGGQHILNWVGDITGWWAYLELNQFTAGMLTIGVIFGAYMTETFRAAYQCVPRGEIDAAHACGMTRRQVFTRIALAHIIEHGLPGFSNNWLVLLKTTALVSVIGLPDIVWQAFTAGRASDQLFAFFVAVIVVYLGLTALSDLALGHLQRRYNPALRRVG